MVYTYMGGTIYGCACLNTERVYVSQVVFVSSEALAPGAAGLDLMCRAVARAGKETKSAVTVRALLGLSGAL